MPPLDQPEWLTPVDMMGSMDHGAMDHGAMDHGAMDHAAMGHMDHGAMDHSQHGMAAPRPARVPSTKARHARTEYGPGTDMRIDMACTNLDDPGIGLRNNGRRC